MGEKTIKKTQKEINRKSGRLPAFNPVTDPSPEEIAKRALEIRLEWTEEEARRRAGILSGVVPITINEPKGVHRLNGELFYHWGGLFSDSENP